MALPTQHQSGGLPKTGDSPYMEAPPIPSKPNSRQNTPRRERMATQPQLSHASLASAASAVPAAAKLRPPPDNPSSVPHAQEGGSVRDPRSQPQHHNSSASMNDALAARATPHSTPGAMPLPAVTHPPPVSAAGTPMEALLGAPSAPSRPPPVSIDRPPPVGVGPPRAAPTAQLHSAAARPPPQPAFTPNTVPLRDALGGDPVYSDQARGGGYPPYPEQGGIATPPPPLAGGGAPQHSFAALDRVRQLEQQLASTQEQLLRERQETHTLHRAYGDPYAQGPGGFAPPPAAQTVRPVHQPPLPLSPPPAQNPAGPFAPAVPRANAPPPGYRATPAQPYRDPPGPTTPGAWPPRGDAPIFKPSHQGGNSETVEADRLTSRTPHSTPAGSLDESPYSVGEVERLQRLLEAEREANEELQERFGAFLQSTQAQLREIREEVRAKEEENLTLRHALGDREHDHGARPYTTIAISPRGSKPDPAPRGGKPAAPAAGKRAPKGPARRDAAVHGYSKEIHTPQQGWQHLG